MNIYENDVGTEEDPAYLGCYFDPADNRVFVREAASDDMSAEVSWSVRESLCRWVSSVHVVGALLAMFDTPGCNCLRAVRSV